VNSQKLAKTLKKELTRNPKKTAALAIGLGVALWFWAPLLWKWTGGGADKSKSKAAAAADAKETPAKAAATPAQSVTTELEGSATPVLPMPAWNRLLDEIAADPKMQVAVLKKNPRDPFEETALEKKVAPPEQKLANGTVKPVIVVDPTPDSLGIVLEATLISRDSRATLSGKVYRAGEAISVPAPVDTHSATDAAATNDKGAQKKKTIDFVIERIEARRVVLVRNQKNYELRIVRDELADGLDRSTAPKQKPR
jgi:hypothetical protein